MTMRVAVIGGGWAGLACAVELARAEIPVEVFESARELGGRARVVEKDGWRVDNGQHILIGAYEQTLGLMRLLGLSPKRLQSSPFYLHIPGQLDLAAPALPAPFHLAAALFHAKGLAWSDCVAAARLLRSLKRCAFRLGEDYSVTALLQLTAQTEKLCRLIWEPLCLATLNTPAERASAQVFANVLRDSLASSASASELLLPRVDLTELLPTPASLYLLRRGHTVHFSTRIRSIRPEGERFWLDGAPGEALFSHVVIATAPWQVAALTAEFSELARLREQLGALSHEAITTVYLRYEPALRMPKPMIGLDGRFLQWVFDRGQLGGPEGLLAGVVSAADTKLPRQEAALRAHRDIEHLFADRGRHLPAPIWSQVITEKRAGFAATPGLSRPIALTPVRRLLLAGDYVASDYPATLEGAVRSGLNAAKTVMRGEGISPPPRYSIT
ncbi:hydroxysqualene dehydroxylase HpnE [Niveibacterium terrae]|uniref:hydroxysqualene dehydroxylase HpnE n=1 Tax=Niveibacterium terrae TaxID=3373598 RepID=UPI003A91BCEE